VRPAFHRSRRWGTAVALGVTRAADLPAARAQLEQELDAMDDLANRFRPDSEISRLNHAGGHGPQPVSPALAELVATACWAAEVTDGAVDPTVGQALLDLGYDRDFALVAAGPDTPDAPGATPAPVPGWRRVAVDAGRGTVTLPAGTRLDLGATAKAVCADRAARRVAGELGTGVLVDLGGDLAVAGDPPPGGWSVVVREEAGGGRLDGPCVIAVHDGGLASSGTTVRSWSRRGTRVHHIVDPATGWPAEPVWRTVTVAAATCLAANAVSTAAVVWGEDAPFEVAQRGLPGRLVHRDGTVVCVGGWPEP
jgi:thiamine biosynthesis lipoprotein